MNNSWGFSSQTQSQLLSFSPESTRCSLFPRRPQIVADVYTNMESEAEHSPSLQNKQFLCPHILLPNRWKHIYHQLLLLLVFYNHLLRKHIPQKCSQVGFVSSCSASFLLSLWPSWKLSRTKGHKRSHLLDVFNAEMFTYVFNAALCSFGEASCASQYIL